MYFKIFISKSWSERFAGSRRRLIQSFPGEDDIFAGNFAPLSAFLSKPTAASPFGLAAAAL